MLTTNEQGEYKIHWKTVHSVLKKYFEQTSKLPESDPRHFDCYSFFVTMGLVEDEIEKELA